MIKYLSRFSFFSTRILVVSLGFSFGIITANSKPSSTEWQDGHMAVGTSPPSPALASSPPDTPHTGAKYPKDSTLSKSASQNAAVVNDKFARLQKRLNSQNEIEEQDTQSLGGTLLRIFFALIAVLGMAVVAIRLLRKTRKGMLAAAGAGEGMFEVIEVCHLGPNQKVMALRIRDQVAILGVGKESVNLLTTLDVSADFIARERREKGNPAYFADSLNKMLDRFKKPKKVSELLEEA